MAYELAKAYVQIVPTTKGIKGNLENLLGNEADTAGKSAGSKFGSGFGGALKNVGKVAAGALAAGTAALGAFGKSAVEAGMSFDESMSQVAATMGLSMDEMMEQTGSVELAWGTFTGNLREYAQEMGANTAFSASEAADALNYMALAGYDAQTSMEMLPNVLNLAAAGGIDLALASDMVTDASSALGLELDETTELVDKMAKASSKSNTSVAQLGDAILKIGGTANVLSGGTTELSTALGLLADNGIKGAEGGTHLRNVILSLSAPTDAAAGLLKELGVETVDATGNMRPLQDIMLELGKSLEGMGSADKAATIAAIFNKTDIASVNALLGTNKKRWEELSAEIDDAAGSAQQMADTQLDNLAGDITLMKSAFEGLQIAISDGTTPAIRGVVSGLTEVINGFNDVVSGVEGGTDKIKSGFSNILNSITDSLPAILDIFTAVFEGIIDSLPNLLSTLFDSVIKILGSLLPSLANILPGLITAVMNMITQLVSHLSEIIMPVIKALPNIVKSIVTGLIDNLPVIINGLIDLVTDIVSELPSICAEIIEYIPELFIGIGKAIVEAIPKIIGAVVKLVKNIARTLVGLKDPVKEAEDKLTGLADRANFAWEHIEETLNKPVSTEGLLSSLGHTEDEIQQTIDEKETAIKEILSARLEEQQGLREEDLEKIREYKEQIKALEEEKLSIYQQQAEAELTAMQSLTDASALELLERYNNLKQYNDMAREAAEAAYNQELVDANNQHTAMLAGLQEYLDNGGSITDAAYLEQQQSVEDAYQKMVDTAKSSYDERLAALDETEAQALAIALDGNNNFVQTLNNGMTEAKAVYDDGLSHITQVMRDWDFITGGATDMTAEAFGQMVDSISSADMLNTQAMMNMIAQAHNMGVEVPQETMDTARLILEAFDGLPDDLQDEGGQALAGLCAGLEDEIPGLQNMSSKSAQELVDTIEKELGIQSPSRVLKEVGVNTIEGLKSGIQSRQSSLLNMTGAVGRNLVSSMRSGINRQAGSLVSAASSAVSRAVSAMSSGHYYSQNFYTGQMLIRGIGDGISSLGGWLGSIAASAVTNAVNAAKRAGDVRSPSHVMRDEVGLMLAKGLGLGIEDGIPYVIDAVNSVNDSMMEQVKDINLTEQILPETIAATADYRQRMQAAVAAGGNLAAMSHYSNISNSSENQNVTLNIYGAAGQDVNALADIIIDRMQWLTAKENAIYA